MIGYTTKRLIGPLACLIVGSLLMAATATAASFPAWQIDQGAQPTNLVPGSEVPEVFTEAATAFPKFHTVVTNLGGAAAEDVRIVTELPTRVSTTVATPPSWFVAGGSPEPCVVAGLVVTCEVGEVQPGQPVHVFIPVDVAEGPDEVVSDQVTVESSTVPSKVEGFTTEISATQPPFGFLPGEHGLAMVSTDEAGEVPVAGSHPVSTTFTANTPVQVIGGGNFQEQRPLAALRSFHFELPQGEVIDPLAPTELCTTAQLENGGKIPPEQCPAQSQVGRAYVSVLGGLEATASPIYAMVPPFGAPAELAFGLVNTNVHIIGGLSGNLRLTAASTEILSRFPIAGIRVELWGVPSAPIHDFARDGVGCESGCSVPASNAPFVTMPSSCAEKPTLDAEVSSWNDGLQAVGTRVMTDLNNDEITVKGCNSVAFEPTITATATTNAGESPTGLDFSVHQALNEELEGRATAPLKNARVALPAGMTVNAAGANGLDACTESQMGYEPRGGKIRFTTAAQTCPDAAKVGTVAVNTPLVGHSLPGSIYIAKPFANPFGSLLTIYLAVEDKSSGIVTKLAGKVEPDPQTGQLTATFTENPELPLEEIKLHFFEGSNAVLATPLTCGTKTTTSTLTPWSTPEGADAHPSDSFQVSAGCASSEAAASKGYFFRAGSQTPLSGAYSPFVLKIARGDGTQHITSLDTTLPPGLLGKLAGVAYCPESGIAQARSREKPEQGKLEQGSPSCPSSSEVGTVNVTAGSGNSPIPVSGHAYLAGPYKGAPLSLVVIVPAVAGPFDLGTVVDRVALNVGEYDARIHAVADPLPTIREGIPLDVRSIELKLDRPSFTLNPTSCEAMQIEGSVSTQAGQSQTLANRFQVGECGRLAFKPALQISLKGATGKSGHPALKAVVTYPKEGLYANIARAQVNLPSSEFLDQGNIAKACTKPVLAQRACPARSIYGKAKAWSPLLAAPLEGPVYLVGGYGYKLPALVAELNGQIRVLLVGKVDSGKNHGIRNTFEAVPDAPVSRFVLAMKGGKKYGLLENSEDICSRPQKAGASFRAQNGRVLRFSSRIANSCRSGSKGKKKHPPQTK